MSNLQSLINHDDDYDYNYIPKKELKPQVKQEPLPLPPTHQGYQQQQQQQQQQQEEQPQSSPSPPISSSDIKSEDLPSSVSEEQILESFERIKTHFPAARIKKIMQSDEEIGKVAQATPIIVGRALEIFMANLVESSILEAKKQGVKRIGVNHIKAAIDNNEKFDFLVDIVKK
ncbi:unnamed protein product [Candida verbasci]|uniref:Transcription factor CBF/NF-Y/archaeal histone domain-containing protein n=1 Tax=Candida verbasci TaxID=1227364 RepID=A0A9W4XBH7_9ASCO|nr:unnamed protein product [Candida verbasci]